MNENGVTDKIRCPTCGGAMRIFRQMYLRCMYWYAECDSNAGHYRWPTKHGFDTPEELLKRAGAK